MNIYKFSIITALIFCCINFSTKAQTYRFIYELEFKSDSTSNYTQKENVVLDITNRKVKFYDYNFIKYDSINKNTGSNIQTSSMTDQLVTRDLNSFINNQYFTFHFDYFLIKTIDIINWKIERETEKISDLTVQKAVAFFGGREWIAWFAKSIPFNEGPYKFRGLPGLIVSVHDSKGNYTYNLIKSQIIKNSYDTTNFLETRYGKSPIEINLSQYQKLLMDNYSDPVAGYKSTIKGGGTVLINNQKIQNNNDLDNMRRSIKERIRKNYNPIELDKAVHYK
ncbi:GLPGLI family protein [Epilithonimonas hominis]|uniref:GLPGLI family protein n=1 Tax=Epilithonimonas hominis TaxID=420404 RepID=UPI00289CC113|nr:GLPGLI family protein [Epilithonimonas hominis]